GSDLWSGAHMDDKSVPRHAGHPSGNQDGCGTLSDLSGVRWEPSYAQAQPLDTGAQIRRCGIDDVPWLLELAEEAYPIGTFDKLHARYWLELNTMSAECHVVRGRRSAGVAQLFTVPWKPDTRVADLIHLFSRNAGLETVRVVRTLAEWAFAAGA